MSRGEDRGWKRLCPRRSFGISTVRFGADAVGARSEDLAYVGTMGSDSGILS